MESRTQAGTSSARDAGSLVGSHKGKKWKEKPSVQRYWLNDRKFKNKRKRVLRCNGEAAANEYDKTGKRAIWGMK